MTCPVGRDPEELAKTLRGWRTVEHAYVPGDEVPASVQVEHDDDPEFSEQAYLFKAPEGIGAYLTEIQGGMLTGLGAWSVPGGDGDVEGEDLRFIDIERGWKFDHEDLGLTEEETLVAGTIDETSDDYFSDTQHGTRTLGVVMARDNDRGVLGIVPRLDTAGVEVISWGLQGDDLPVPDGVGVANALLIAARRLRFGGVVLVEVQTLRHDRLEYDEEGEPYAVPYFVPVESESQTFEAIRLCTALGITVIEPAGNGEEDPGDDEVMYGTDLDTLSDEALVEVVELNPEKDGFEDSGAIMVGASEETTASPPHSRADFSNFGNRVDCFAWGTNVRTTGAVETAMGTLEDAYNNYSGTSSASAITAGAALCVQGMAQATLGYRFSPRQLREILSRPPEEDAFLGSQNTPSRNPDEDRIGVMPNLWWVSQEILNAVPDVYLRDHVGDTGDPAESGAFFRSPDIFVRSEESNDPQGEFGEPPNADSNALGSVVTSGQDNYVYVRLKNRGGEYAENVTATVYYSPPATLTTPNLWTEVGTTTGNVPQGDLLIVFDPIVWAEEDLPDSGHYCFIALVGNDQDPAPEPTEFYDMETYRRFVRERNNVAWRNFTVKPLPTGTTARHAFVAPGAVRELAKMGFRVDAHLPSGSKLFLELPTTMAASLDVAYEEGGDERARVPVNPHGRTTLGPTAFAPGSKTEAALLVFVPPEAPPGRYEAAVGQTFDGEMIGRMTWQFEVEE